MKTPKLSLVLAAFALTQTPPAQVYPRLCFKKTQIEYKQHLKNIEDAMRRLPLSLPVSSPEGKVALGLSSAWWRLRRGLDEEILRCGELAY